MIAILAENDTQNDTQEVKMILKSVFIANSFGIYHYSITFASQKHQEQCNKLHQPSRDATVVKLRCGQKHY